MTEWAFAKTLLLGMAKSLLLTELIELAVAACFPQRNRHDFLLVFLVNVMTNPAVVYLDFWFHYQVPSVWLWVAFLEGTVWFVEALIYRRCLTGKQNPFLFSFLLNAASYGSGVLLGRIL